MTTDVATLFKQITQGVYVVGVSDGHTDNAFTAAWIMQASFQPPLLVLSVNPRHSAYAVMIASGVFALSVLKADQAPLAAHFGRPAVTNKLADIAWERRRTGAPVLSDALAYFDCRIADRCPAGDHELVVGSVIDGAVLTPGAAPLRYESLGDLDGASRLFPDRLGD